MAFMLSLFLAIFVVVVVVVVVNSIHVGCCPYCVSPQQVPSMLLQEGQLNHSRAGGASSLGNYPPLAPAPTSQ